MSCQTRGLSSKRNVRRNTRRSPCAIRPHRSPYNLRHGGDMTPTLSFEEAEQALKEARLMRAGKIALVQPKQPLCMDNSPYTEEMANLYQEEFAAELARVGMVCSIPSFPTPSKSGLGGDIGDRACGVCYSCFTMCCDCVDEQPAGTYLAWCREQVEQVLSRV